MTTSHAAAAAAPIAPAERAPPGAAAAMAPGEGGEVVILNLKPAPAFIILHRLPAFIVMVLLSLAAIFAAQASWLPITGLRALAICIALLVVFLVWERLEWQCRAYVLTDRRAIWVSGVLRQLTVEAPLTSIQHVVMYKSIRERLFGLGTIGLATAGTSDIELVWQMVDKPDEVLAAVRSTIHRYTGHAPRTLAQPAVDSHDPATASPASDIRHPTSHIPIIGLAGGIGSGKSTVAAAFARLGCLVIDSDTHARAALDSSRIRPRLIEWWGPDVLDATGKIDRRKVAAIVFADPVQRTRLESIVHPAVKARRDEIISAAAASPSPPRAFIIDAPLLFEAGLDKDCDAVVFVDAPPEVRLARVRDSRGWDQAELQRRESAQLPPQEKQRRSDYRIDNSGDLAAIDAAAKSVLDSVLRTGRDELAKSPPPA